MVVKKVRKALGYARTAYGIYRTARRYLKRRRRSYSVRRSMLPSVGVKAVSSKRYGAKMNKLYHCGRVQNLQVSLPAFRNQKSVNGKFYHAQLPSNAIALPLQMYLPLEMFYLKRYYQSFKIHRFKVTATVASVTGIPTSVTNPIARIAIGADYLYRRKFWTTDNDSQNNNGQLIRAALDYADMMELPNVKTRDLLLSNLNNGSTVSCYVSPGRGCINPNISTDKVETGTRPALQDFDTEHGTIVNSIVSKASSQLYVAQFKSSVVQEEISNELMAYYFPSVYLGVYLPWNVFQTQIDTNGSMPASLNQINVNFLVNIQCTYSMNGYIYTQDYQGIDPIPSIVGESSIVTKPITVSTFAGMEDNIQDKMFVIPQAGITGMVAQGNFNLGPSYPDNPGPEPGPPTPPQPPTPITPPVPDPDDKQWQQMIEANHDLKRWTFPGPEELDKLSPMSYAKGLPYNVIPLVSYEDFPQYIQGLDRNTQLERFLVSYPIGTGGISSDKTWAFPIPPYPEAPYPFFPPNMLPNYMVARFFPDPLFIPRNQEEYYELYDKVHEKY